MIYHAASVVRGVDRCLVVVDLPSVPIRETQKKL
jgi:ketopantoate hydroxymethyltransferase